MRRFIRNVTLGIVVSFLYSNIVWAGGLPTETLAQDAGRILAEIFTGKEPGKVQDGFQRFLEIGQIDKGLVFSQIAGAVTPNIENKELLNVYKEILFAIFLEEFRTNYPRIKKDAVEITGITASGEIVLSSKDNKFTYYLSYIDNRLIVTESSKGRSGETSAIGNTLAVSLLPLLTTLLFGTSCKTLHRPPVEPGVPTPQTQPQLPTPGVPAEVQAGALPLSATAQLPNAEEVTSKFDAWLKRISDTRTGLPPSHVGDTRPVAVQHGFATGGFTYDLAQLALRYARTGNFAEAKKIILYFSERYNAYTLEQLMDMRDRNNVYGILRILPALDGRWYKYFVNRIDTSSPWKQGNGIIEWYVDGGPQAWLLMAAIQLFELDRSLSQTERDELERFVVELADSMLALFSQENVVSAGPRLQDIGGAPQREHLGHIENMWDHYAFLNQLADYFEGKRDQFRPHEYRRMARAILRGLKEKGAVVKEGDQAYFWHGFIYGGLNRQIPTDVQSWGILSVGPRRLNEIFGAGTAEGMMNWLIRHALVLIDYIKPDGFRVTTIGADFSDPYLPDMIRQRGGVKAQITDEWTAGVITAMEVMADYYSETGKRKEAEELLAMADALKWFAIQRAVEHEGMLYWEYSTEPDMPTGYGWNTPDANGGSLAGNQMLMALLGINPFDLERALFIRFIRSFGIKSLGVDKGIELLSQRMSPGNKFSRNPVGGQPKKVDKPNLPWAEKKKEGELGLTDPSIFKKIAFYSEIGEGAGRILSTGESIGIKTVAEWNAAEISFRWTLDLSNIPYLTITVKGTKGVGALRINVVDSAYIQAKEGTRAPAYVEKQIPGDNQWHEYIVNLAESGADITQIKAISFEVGTTTGNEMGAEVYIEGFKFVKGKGMPSQPVPQPRTPGAEERPSRAKPKQVSKPSGGTETVICSGRCPRSRDGVVFFKDGIWEISDDDYFIVAVQGTGEYIFQFISLRESFIRPSLLYTVTLKMGKTYKIYFKDFPEPRENVISEIGINVQPNPWGLRSKGGIATSITIKLVKGGHTQIITPDKTRLANGIDRGYTDGKLARYGNVRLQDLQGVYPNPQTRFLARRNSQPRHSKSIAGKLADHEKDINPHLRKWIMENRTRIKVIDYYFEDGRWVPYKVDYSIGRDDKGNRLTDDRYQLSDEEQKRLNETLKSCAYDELGRPVRFRIVLDETAAAWLGDIGHSSLVHVGERTRTIWFGEHLFRDLLKRDIDILREEIFIHEKRHLLGQHEIDTEAAGYIYLVTAVYSRYKALTKTPMNRLLEIIRENLAPIFSSFLKFIPLVFIFIYGLEYRSLRHDGNLVKKYILRQITPTLGYRTYDMITDKEKRRLRDGAILLTRTFTPNRQDEDANIEMYVYKIPLDRYKITIGWSGEFPDERYASDIGFLLNRKGAAIAINGAYRYGSTPWGNSADMNPIGLLILEGKEIVSFDPRLVDYRQFGVGGFGEAIVGITGNGEMEILSVKDYSKPELRKLLLNKKYRYARQTGPLLIYKGRIMDDNDPDGAEERDLRSALAYDNKGNVYFIVSRSWQPVSVPHFSYLDFARGIQQWARNKGITIDYAVQLDWSGTTAMIDNEYDEGIGVGGNANPDVFLAIPNRPNRGLMRRTRPKAWVGNELENAEAIISGRSVNLDGELDKNGNYIIPRRDIHIPSRVGDINYEIIHLMEQSYFTVKVTKEGVTTEKKVFAMPVGEGKVLVTNKLWQLLQQRESVSKQLLSHEGFEQASNEERLGILNSAHASLQNQDDKEDFQRLCRESGINLEAPDGHIGGEIMELVNEYQRGRENGIYQRFSDVLISSLDATLLGARLSEILGIQVDVDDFTQKLVRPRNTSQIVLGMISDGKIDLELVSRAFGAVESTNGDISTLGTDYTTKATLVLANTWAWENREIGELKDILGEGLLGTLINGLREKGYTDVISEIRELLIKVRHELGRIAQIEGGKIRLSSPYLHTLIARIATMAGIQPQALLAEYYNDLISDKAHTKKDKLVSAVIENALVEVGVVNKKGILGYESSVDTKLVEMVRKIGVGIYGKNIPSTTELKNPVDTALEVDRNRDPFGIIEDILLSSPFTGELNCSKGDLSGLISLLELLNLDKMAQRIGYTLPDNLKTEKRLDTLVISLDHLFTIEKVDPETGVVTIVPKALGVTERIIQVLKAGTNVKIVAKEGDAAVIKEAVEKYLGLKTSQFPALTIQIAKLNNIIEGLKNPQNSTVIATEREAGGLRENRGAFVYVPQAGELLGDVITVVTNISLTPEGKFTEGSQQIFIDYLRKQVPEIDKTDKTDIWQEVLALLKAFDNSHAVYFALPAVVKFTDKLKELQLYKITVLIAA